MSLGNPNWAGSVCAVIVKTQIGKAKGRGGDGWGRVLVCPTAKAGQGKAFDQGETLHLVLEQTFQFSSGDFILVF